MNYSNELNFTICYFKVIQTLKYCSISISIVRELRIRTLISRINILWNFKLLKI